MKTVLLAALAVMLVGCVCPQKRFVYNKPLDDNHYVKYTVTYNGKCEDEKVIEAAAQKMVDNEHIKQLVEHSPLWVSGR